MVVKPAEDQKEVKRDDLSAHLGILGVSAIDTKAPSEGVQWLPDQLRAMRR